MADPNYAPYNSDDLNSFRLQAPGSFGALAAPNLMPESSVCQAECGQPAVIWVQVANTGEFISADAGVQVSLYGQSGGSSTNLGTQAVPTAIGPGVLSEAVAFSITNWADYDSIFAVVDDPDAGSGSAEWGTAKECDEDDNQEDVDLSGLCE